MHKGSLEFALTESSCIVMLIDDITWEISADLDTFLGCIVNDVVFKEIFFDLSKTAYMDSTSLGVLAHFKRIALERNISLSLLNPSELIFKNLQDVGLNKIFEIRHFNYNEQLKVNAIPSSKKYSSREISVLVRKTHLALMGIDEKNRTQFSQIVSAIDKETSQ